MALSFQDVDSIKAGLKSKYGQSRWEELDCAQVHESSALVEKDRWQLYLDRVGGFLCRVIYSGLTIIAVYVMPVDQHDQSLAQGLMYPRDADVEVAVNNSIAYIQSYTLNPHPQGQSPDESPEPVSLPMTSAFTLAVTGSGALAQSPPKMIVPSNMTGISGFYHHSGDA